MAKQNLTSAKIIQETLFKGKKYPSLDALLKVRKAIGPARFYMKSRNETLSKALFGIYTRLSNILDKKIAQELGGTLLSNQRGRGVTPDVIFEDTVTEAKAISTTTDPRTGEVIKASGIGIAGGRGLKLRTGEREFATGVRQGQLTTEKAKFTQGFLDILYEARNNQAQLKMMLSGRNKAASLLRKNFMLKSGDIRVPITVGNKKKLKAIRFTWKEIKRNPNAKIKVTKNDEGDIYFNIYFTPSLVIKALNKANKAAEVELQKLSLELAKDLAEEFAAFSPAVLKFLDKNPLVQNIEADEGSVLLGKGVIKKRKGRTKDTQRFISGAQITAMLQKLMGQKMPKGPRRGPPLSENILTERTGRFRRSVMVVPNYRKNLMKYMYDPIYKTFIDTPRNPDEFIEQSLRAVIQRLYGRQFNIIRGN